jgi:hypothetical protein
VKNSKEGVIIGDAATWAACDQTKTYECPTSSRAFGQLAFTAKESSQIAGDCYAYVRNYDGQINANGLRVRDL